MMNRPTLVSLCERVISRVAARYWLQSQERDDFAQDAWLEILTSLKRGHFDPREGQLEDWLFIVVRNCAVNFLRRLWRSEPRVDYPLELLPCGTSVDPSYRLERLSRIEALGSALELLAQDISPMSFAVFQLRQLEQASIADVAARLGLTVGQVRVYDHRARRKLASILTNRGWL